MKTTINQYDFERAFADADRKENFSYEGLGLLFVYFEEYEESTGEEIELDVIAICCEYAEDTFEDIAANYSIDLRDDDDNDTLSDNEKAEIVRDYLNDNTHLIGETATGFVYEIF
jgi:hypothetical protein